MAANKEKCPSCGQFIKAGSPFCIRCGAQIKKLSIDEEDPTAKEEKAPVQNIQSAPAEEKRLKPASYIEQPTRSNEEPQPKVPPARPATPQVKPVSVSQEAKESIPPAPQYTEDDPMESEFEDEESENMLEEELEEDSEDPELYEEDHFIEYESDDEEPDNNSATDDDADDDEAFNALINGTNNSSEESKKHKKEESPAANNKWKVFGKDNLHKNSREPVQSQPVAKRKVQTSDVDKQPAKPQSTSKTKAKAQPQYDPNEDHYYDNVMAEVDARISHLSKENVVLTISFVLICIVVLVAMIYCVVL